MPCKAFFEPFGVLPVLACSFFRAFRRADSFERVGVCPAVPELPTFLQNFVEPFGVQNARA